MRPLWNSMTSYSNRKKQLLPFSPTWVDVYFKPERLLQSFDELVQKTFAKYQTSLAVMAAKKPAKYQLT